MGKQKLTPKQVEELRAAYEAWNPHDPDSESAAELAARFGISKQTMYTLRKQWQEEQARQRRREGKSTSDLDPETAQAILFLTEELMRARLRIIELEDQLAERRNHNGPRGA